MGSSTDDAKNPVREIIKAVVVKLVAQNEILDDNTRKLFIQQFCNQSDKLPKMYFALCLQFNIKILIVVATHNFLISINATNSITIPEHNDISRESAAAEKEFQGISLDQTVSNLDEIVAFTAETAKTTATMETYGQLQKKLPRKLLQTTSPTKALVENGALIQADLNLRDAISRDKTLQPDDPTASTCIPSCSLKTTSNFLFKSVNDNLSTNVWNCYKNVQSFYEDNFSIYYRISSCKYPKTPYSKHYQKNGNGI